MSGANEAQEREWGQTVRRRVRSVAPACVALYLAVAAGVLIAILHRNGGIFTYSLDDPYIHLALAENIAHGHYGINASEASSPSSSIVWPLLLAPFAASRWGEYLPLGLNALFCGIAAWLIGRIVDGWDGESRTTFGMRGRIAGFLTGAMSGWPGRFAVAASLLLVANLAGLTFTGMEHGLQVLLAVGCAAGMTDALAGRRIPVWCLWAAVLGPMVRYENLALVAAMAVALYGQRRTRAAAALVGASLVVPVAFSIFLVSRGLPALPSSVMVKGHIYDHRQGPLMAFVRTVHGSVYVGVQQGGWWGLLGVAAVLLWLAVRERQPSRRWALAGALLAAVLHLLLGHFNWLHRYEVYATIFTTLVAATALREATHLRPAVLTAALLALGGPYAVALWDTPAAASDVYRQQYQMHRFVADFYRKTVAVNDLGWVSYRRPPGLYVLDLWGLASPEASRQTVKDSEWLDAITAAHGAGLAMIYPAWFDEGAPDDWSPLGTMCFEGRAILSRRCVVFYSTQVGDKALLTAEMAAFAKTLPEGVKMTLGKDTSDDEE